MEVSMNEDDAWTVADDVANFAPLNQALNRLQEVMCAFDEWMAAQSEKINDLELNLEYLDGKIIAKKRDYKKRLRCADEMFNDLRAKINKVAESVAEAEDKDDMLGDRDEGDDVSTDLTDENDGASK